VIGLAVQHTGKMWDNDLFSTHERSSTCIGHNVLVHLACGFDNMLMCKRKVWLKTSTSTGRVLGLLVEQRAFIRITMKMLDRIKVV
jgi:hypothetical protein